LKLAAPLARLDGEDPPLDFIPDGSWGNPQESSGIIDVQVTPPDASEWLSTIQEFLEDGLEVEVRLAGRFHFPGPPAYGKSYFSLRLWVKPGHGSL
jgi:hypothetical protein